MPIIVELHGTYRLGDHWISKEEFEGLDVLDILELFQEDTTAFLEDLGGLDGIVKTVRWEDAQ